MRPDVDTTDCTIFRYKSTPLAIHYAHIWNRLLIVLALISRRSQAPSNTAEKDGGEVVASISPVFRCALPDCTSGARLITQYSLGTIFGKRTIQSRYYLPSWRCAFAQHIDDFDSLFFRGFLIGIFWIY